MRSNSSKHIKGKIAEPEKSKIYTMLVIGCRDVEADNVSVRFAQQ